jgi:hypothetical protein
MITVDVALKGITPLMMDPMSEEILDSIFTKVPMEQRRDRPAYDVAAEKVVKENGVIGIPADNLYACFIAAGQLVKFEGNTKVSTGKSSLLPSFLTIPEMFLPLTDGNGSMVKDDDWVVDKRRGVTKKGEAQCVIRPRFDHWGLNVTLIIDEKIFHVTKVRGIVEKAGLAKGLGSFRPGTRGRFGQFMIASWTVQKTKSTDEEAA